MKIISRSLTVLTMAFLVACSSDESANLLQENPEQGQINEGLAQGDPEEYNILEVENDPDFVMEGPGTENKMSKVAGRDDVEVSQIRAYLAKDKNATGRVYYELHDITFGFQKLIARSGSFDVQKLATYSSSTPRYTSLYWNINIPLDVTHDYYLKVKCRDCEQSGENTNVYWWQTDSENDNPWRFAFESKEGSSENDFTFNVMVRRDDGTTYNNQYNFKRKIATPINLGIEYKQLFNLSFEFPCEPLSQLTISEVELNDVEEDPSGNNKKLTFSLTNISNKETLLSDIYTQYDLFDITGQSKLFFAPKIPELSEDEEVKNTAVMPPNTTTQFSFLFNTEPDGAQYKEMRFSLSIIDSNNGKWCEETPIILNW